MCDRPGVRESQARRRGAAGQRLGRVPYMPQKDLLLPWRTTLDNVILPLEVRGVPRAER